MKRLALTAVAVAVIASTPPQVARAEPAPGGPAPTVAAPSAFGQSTPEKGKEPTRSEGSAFLAPRNVTGMSSLAAATSPAGCVGQTDYAHRSGDDASVHGRTECRYNVPEVRVATTLQRHRWWGWESLASMTKSRTAFWTTYDATPHKSCYHEGQYIYRGISDHRSLESGTYYYAYTKSAQENTWWC